MVWTDKDIKKWIEDGNCSPASSNINPASLDLTLNWYLREPRMWWRIPIVRNVVWQWMVAKGYNYKNHPELYWSDIKPFHEYILKPGHIVLASSMEYTNIPPDMCAVLFSKSTIGRIMLEHMHAGFGDPGFHGQWTFELINNGPWPIILRPGMRIMQLVFFRLDEVPEELYAGRYQGQLGPTTPREEKCSTQ